jgi:hypothetical protein
LMTTATRPITPIELISPESFDVQDRSLSVVSLSIYGHLIALLGLFSRQAAPDQDLSDSAMRFAPETILRSFRALLMFRRRHVPGDGTHPAMGRLDVCNPGLLIQLCMRQECSGAPAGSPFRIFRLVSTFRISTTLLGWAEGIQQQIGRAEFRGTLCEIGGCTVHQEGAHRIRACKAADAKMSEVPFSGSQLGFEPVGRSKSPSCGREAHRLMALVGIL